MKDLAKEWRNLMYGGVPQSTTKRDREEDSGIEQWTRKGLANRCYCISCGKESGAVLKFTTNIIFICDNCYPKYGGVPVGYVSVEDHQQFLKDFEPKIQVFNV